MNLFIADVVWPALYLENRLLTWWAIIIGLLIEYVFIYYIFRRSIQKTGIMTLVANSISTVIGIVLIPAIGIGWEIFPGIMMYKILHIGTFSPITWTVTLVFATLANGVIESLSYKFIFRENITKRIFWLICLANLASVGLALATVLLYPPKL